VSVLTNVVNLVSVLVFTFYLLLSRDKLSEQLGFYFSKQRQDQIEKIVLLLEKRLGGWLRGQVALMIMVGSATYIGLFILNIPFALPLSILAGLLEIIPYLGPVASAVPAVLIGLGISPIVGLAVVALYFLIQQLENYIFVPKVMQRTVGVSPIVTLLALAIGFELAGITGVIISVPLVVVLQVLVDEYLLKKNASK
jgi:predicted PurR-regulated permease PerM